MVVKMFRRHSILACAGLLVAAVAITMLVNAFRPQKAEPVNASAPESSFSQASSNFAAEVSGGEQKEEEMRAVWVPYMSLDMSKEEDKSEAAFQKKFDAIVSGAKEYGMNTLIVHVRPFGDALYSSKLYPWSHTVGGTQGVNPGYDPLAYMVGAAHKAGLAFHAWVNPLRIQVNGTPSILAESNPFHTWGADGEKAGWAVESGGGKYYNPGYAPVRKYIADGVKEIVENYDVDGVQFDDYFYPSGDESFDKAAYEAYYTSAVKNGNPLSLLEWRQANINEMVSLVYREVKEAKPKVVFGIAPQGNLQNDHNMGANVETWCRARGFVDYICPQLYVNFDNATLPFGAAAETWKGLVKEKSIKLYLGLGVYKAGSDADEGTWKSANDILARQVSLGRELKCDGFMFYSWPYLSSDQTKDEVANVVKLFQ